MIDFERVWLYNTDIEKNRRLPSLQNQNKIKKLLASKQFPETLFDDLAAADNEDTRIVAEDIAKDIRKKPALRELIRVIHKQKLTAAQIAALTASIGGNANGKWKIESLYEIAEGDIWTG